MINLIYLSQQLENKMVDIEKYKDEGLSKIFSSHLIKSIYPMVDRIDVYEPPVVDFLVFRIFLNDPTITKDNMYQKGMDPHYLVDKYGKRYLKYFGYSKRLGGYVLFTPDGDKIDQYIY